MLFTSDSGTESTYEGSDRFAGGVDPAYLPLIRPRKDHYCNEYALLGFGVQYKCARHSLRKVSIESWGRENRGHARIAHTRFWEDPQINAAEQLWIE